MYGGNTKYHVNPYIQGTTVPCDTAIQSDLSSPSNCVHVIVYILPHCTQEYKGLFLDVYYIDFRFLVII